jgi:hypothetical protein
MKTLKNNLDVIIKRFEDVSRQVSFKIEIAENRLIENELQNELINQPTSKVEN